MRKLAGLSTSKAAIKRLLNELITDPKSYLMLVDISIMKYPPLRYLPFLK
jgi:hypothetical protein